MRLFAGRAKSKHPDGYLFSLFSSGKDVKVFALYIQLSQSFTLFFSSYLNNFKGSICMLSTRISFKYFIKSVYGGGGG